MNDKNYHWRELTGNPYLVRFDPRMLLPDGYKMIKFGHPPYAKYADPKVAFTVSYDRDFVVNQWRYFLGPYLECLELDEVMALIKEAVESRQ